MIRVNQSSACLNLSDPAAARRTQLLVSVSGYVRIAEIAKNCCRKIRLCCVHKLLAAQNLHIYISFSRDSPILSYSLLCTVHQPNGSSSQDDQLPSGTSASPLVAAMQSAMSFNKRSQPECLAGLFRSCISMMFKCLNTTLPYIWGLFTKWYLRQNNM